MTAGNDGTPENDDPFGYLYRAEDGTEQPAAPRTSYNQVQRVGERRSPQQQQQPGGYGYPPAQPPQQQGGYGYPPAQQQPYGYDQAQGGQGAPGPYGGDQPQYARQQPQYDPGQPGDGGGRRGAGPGGPDAPNRKGLLIAAIAVVVAVAIGIAVAMSQGDGKKNEADDKPTSAPTSQSTPSTQPTTPSAAPTQFASDKTDASTFALAGGAKQNTQWPGANAANGTYVDGMGAVGASATWTVTVPEDGAYTFFVNYGNAGPDATLSLAVNDKMRTTPVKLKNYGSYTDWSKAWNNTTYAWVNLKKGDNTLQLSFQQGDTGGVNLDQTWLKQGQVTK